MNKNVILCSDGAMVELAILWHSNQQVSAVVVDRV